MQTGRLHNFSLPVSLLTLKQPIKSFFHVIQKIIAAQSYHESPRKSNHLDDGTLNKSEGHDSIISHVLDPEYKTYVSVDSPE